MGNGFAGNRERAKKCAYLEEEEKQKRMLELNTRVSSSTDQWDMGVIDLKGWRDGIIIRIIVRHYCF